MEACVILVGSRINNQVFCPSACPLSQLYDEVQAWLREGLGVADMIPAPLAPEGHPLIEAMENYDLTGRMFALMLADTGVRP